MRSHATGTLRKKKSELIYQYKTFIHGSGRDLSDELIAVILCDELGWTFDEFQSQPLWFIKLLLIKMGIDSERIKKKMKADV